MRSIKIYLAVSLLAITGFNARAQAPGYLGKRFIVGYDMYTMPALRNYNENGNMGIGAFNTRHVFNVDWVNGLSQSIGFSVQFTESTFEFSRGLEFTYRYQDWGSPSTTTQTVYFGDTRGKVSSLAVGLHTNLYLNQFIAPLGTYFKPEILLIRLKSTFDDSLANLNLAKNTMGGSQVMLNYPKLVNNGVNYTAAIGATIGTHYIFFDRLIFDIGFQIGYVIGGKKLSELMEMDGTSTKQINEENYVSVSAKSRLMSQYFINVNAGLGILIF
jgi:hypothetical protein